MVLPEADSRALSLLVESLVDVLALLIADRLIPHWPSLSYGHKDKIVSLVGLINGR